MTAGPAWFSACRESASSSWPVVPQIAVCMWRSHKDATGNSAPSARRSESPPRFLASPPTSRRARRTTRPHAGKPRAYWGRARKIRLSPAAIPRTPAFAAPGCARAPRRLAESSPPCSRRPVRYLRPGRLGRFSRFLSNASPRALDSSGLAASLEVAQPLLQFFQLHLLLRQSRLQTGDNLFRCAAAKRLVSELFLFRRDGFLQSFNLFLQPRSLCTGIHGFRKNHAHVKHRGRSERAAFRVKPFFRNHA